MLVTEENVSAGQMIKRGSTDRRNKLTCLVGIFDKKRAVG